MRAFLDTEDVGWMSRASRAVVLRPVGNSLPRQLLTLPDISANFVTQKSALAHPYQAWVR